nr:unnamed protein product [Callosobruchus analis]
MSSNGDENTPNDLRSRSKSLDLVGEVPLWSDEATTVRLQKTDKGLGFSILDYQDPVNPAETVIVIRSIIPGGTAEQEGTILPGDRLLKVNQIDVSRATLDQAVNVLKGAPNGTVFIEVAKPIMLTGNGTLSHHDSEDTEDDQLTCLDDFQECIEDFQECLDTIHICIDGDDDLPFNHSPCTSTFEDYGRKSPKSKSNFFQEADFLEVGEDQNFDSIETELMNFKTLNVEHSTANDSDVDLSYKSINETIIKVENKKNLDKHGTYRADSLTHSDKDGYDTCIEESLSEDVTTQIKITNTSQSDIHQFETELHQKSENDDNNENVKPTSLLEDKEEESRQHAKENLYRKLNKRPDCDGKAVGFVETVFVVEDSLEPVEDVSDAKRMELCTNSITSSLIAASAPCLNVETPSARHICLDTKPMDSQLKSYDNSIDTLEEDEFFLVQYPSEVSNEVTKSYSEPNVLADDCQTLQKFERSSKFKRRSYRKCLNEYYNDYEDCLEALGRLKAAGTSPTFNSEQETTNLTEDETKSSTEQHKTEMSDDEIFTNIVLPMKNRSAPDILDTSFVTMTYDPGPYLDVTRRKSAFVFGEQGYDAR